MKDYKMKDYIEERNRKEKMASSIIKRRNINYSPLPEPSASSNQDNHPSGSEPDRAAQILNDLKENSQANQILKQMPDNPESAVISQEEIHELLKDR